MLYRVKVILFVMCQIPSLIISLLIFLFFATHRLLLRDIRHQAILLLLVVNFIQLSGDLPMIIHFYRIGYVSPSTPGYCVWWTFFEYTLEVTAALLTATISIQRHLLVFHEHMLNVRFKLFALYYAPLLFCLVYPPLLYLILIVLYPCDGTQWDYTSSVCGFANCHLVYSKTLATFDWTAHNGIPTAIIIISNIFLILRVVKQKLRQQQRVVWKKQRRLTVQLLGISGLFLLAWLPSLIIALVQQLLDPSFLAQVQKDYTIEMIYLMCLFLPWVCVGQLPRFTQWIRTRLCPKDNPRTNTVRPL